MKPRASRSSPAFIRLTFAVVGLAGALALAGCGDDDDGGSPARTGEGSSVAPKLTSAQFAALQKVHQAAVSLDRLDSGRQTPSQARLQAAAQPIVEACDALDTDDELLSALREACLAAARFLLTASGAATCRGVQSCERALDETRTAARELVERSRDADRAVGAARIPAACKRALGTSPVVYRYYRRLDARLGRLIDALSSGSVAKVRRANAALTRLEGDGVPSGLQFLATFRMGCR